MSTGFVRGFTLLLVLPAAPLVAQEVLAIIEPAAAGLDYGNHVAFVGDQDGDGVPEVAVGEYQSDRVTVLDGAFGDVRHQLPGGPTLDGFGSDAAGADFDGDGLADLAVGRWFVDQVRLYGGLDGQLLNVFAHVSRALDVVGDVDGDGLDDLVGADDTFDVAGASSAGRVRVYSSATGLSLFVDTGTLTQDRLGQTVLGPGDLDGDGVPDVVYGEPGEGPGTVLWIDLGAVHAASLASGAPLWDVTGTQTFEAFGASLAAPGDIDLDGVPDVAFGAVGSNPAVHVLSGATGATLAVLPSPSIYEDYGTSLAGAGDVNGDGVPDLAIGIPNAAGFGRVELVDGATAGLLASLSSPDLGTWALGQSLDGPADVNADGIPDLVVGQPDIAHPWDEGRALLASTRNVPWQHLGHALAGASDGPLLRVEGLPVTDTEVVLRLAGGPPFGFAWLALGDGAVNRPAFGGVFVPALSALLPAVLDAHGRAVFSGRWPNVPATVEPTFQAWLLDGSGPEGWTASNALAAERPGD